MSGPPDRGTIWFVAPFIMLLLCGAMGMYGFPDGARSAATRGQLLGAYSGLGYGVTGMLAAFAFYTGHRATMPLLVLWATLLTVTGGLAPVVWGGAPVKIGLLSALATAAVATLVLQLAKRALRSRSSAVSPLPPQ